MVQTNHGIIELSLKEAEHMLCVLAWVGNAGQYGMHCKSRIIHDALDACLQKPDENCPHCHGKGEAEESEFYGTGTYMMICSCMRVEFKL